jgi:phosphatidylserine/phosphatidylglycerophosphate/cardiolipin synthase-like enzyme
MKLEKIVLLSLTVWLMAGACVPAYAAELNLKPGNVQVCFSPGGGCTDLISREIGHARSEILVQAYSFTSAPIAQALVQAHRRGVHVQVILDRSQKGERYTSATFLAHAGVPTWIDPAHAIAHNKIMIIDREIVITGSFNFTKAAEERNAENLLVIRNPDFAEIYRGNWEKHRAHSEKP